MHNTYKLAVVYFVFFSFLLVASAFMIFFTKVGFSFEGVSHYYLGNELEFIEAKTISGLLKVVYPHTFSIGLFAMILLHFVYFTSYRKSKNFNRLILLTYLSISLEVFSPFFLLLGVSIFAGIKLISFVLMFVIFIYLFWLILNSILTQKTSTA